MALKAVLFDFNGVIINDEPLHEQLIEQILISENLRPQPGEIRKVCLGRSDRSCLRDLLANRGRVVSDSYLNELVKRKAQAYQQLFTEKQDKLPIFPGLEDLIFQLRSRNIKLAIVTGAIRSEVELVLTKTSLAKHFNAIVAGDEINNSKPAPDGYLLAVERLNQFYPDTNLQPTECLAIEDTPAGITAAKLAGIPVLGVANTYPFHMLQRQANWTVDYLHDLEIERVQKVFFRTNSSATP
ncbi:HAD family hydrolase [Aliterella atlantica]|uniref:HAD family hydrolase n=1 Tax=Aliterella atlantica CENA595 TaxID=1618023 RepID=A0A0D8ZS50_9CYAN|nr:HAD family phosphatase [Aliterella atlantica]KJH71560.1 HAD family hydrolase [Aliterella atlantica CENA595]